MQIFSPPCSWPLVASRTVHINLSKERDRPLVQTDFRRATLSTHFKGQLLRGVRRQDQATLENVLPKFRCTQAVDLDAVARESCDRDFQKSLGLRAVVANGIFVAITFCMAGGAAAGPPNGLNGIIGFIQLDIADIDA